MLLLYPFEAIKVGSEEEKGEVETTQVEEVVVVETKEDSRAKEVMGTPTILIDVDLKTKH
jgi:hypothetical protein